jgi:hypothetical protein
MKGKILSVLFGLMLVFGMVFVACDNGVAVKPPTGDTIVLDFTGPGGNGLGYANYETDDDGNKTGANPNDYDAIGKQTGDNVLNAGLGLGLW